MIRIAQRFLCLSLLLVLSLHPNAEAAPPDQRTTVTVPADADVPGGVTIRYSTPPHVFPVVVLLAGDAGILSLSRYGWAKKAQGNFAIRSRDLFLANDLKVVLLDAPSNYDENGGLNGKRLTKEHAKVPGRVISHLRSKFQGQPVWVVATSTASLSAVNAASTLPSGPDAPDGIVLVSPIVNSASHADEPHSIFEARLNLISIPTYVVSHKMDTCPRSPGSNVGGNPGAILTALTGLQSDKKELKEFDGGGSVGPACEAFAYHGFNGIEDDVVRNIAVFIKAHTLEP
jgi:hypothetical protein